MSQSHKTGQKAKSKADNKRGDAFARTDDEVQLLVKTTLKN